MRKKSLFKLPDLPETTLSSVFSPLEIWLYKRLKERERKERGSVNGSATVSQ
jgi:hypothetical protein